MSARGEKYRVVIAAREPALRAGMRLALEQIAECTEADGPAAAIGVVSSSRADLCFLDATHGGTGGRAVVLIRSVHPDVHVVLLTHTPTEEEFLQAVHAGAVGYLPENIDPARLPHIVEGVMRGEAAVPRALVRRLLGEVRSAGKRSIVTRDRGEITVTRREAEVLDLLRDGLATHAIARRLGISDVTVRRHRSTLYSKLHVRSKPDLLEALENAVSTARTGDRRRGRRSAT